MWFSCSNLVALVHIQWRLTILTATPAIFLWVNTYLFFSHVPYQENIVDKRQLFNWIDLDAADHLIEFLRLFSIYVLSVPRRNLFVCFKTFEEAKLVKAILYGLSCWCDHTSWLSLVLQRLCEYAHYTHQVCRSAMGGRGWLEPPALRLACQPATAAPPLHVVESLSQ